MVKELCGGFWDFWRFENFEKESVDLSSLGIFCIDGGKTEDDIVFPQFFA